MIREDEIRDSSEVRNNWSHYLDLIENGKSVTMTRRGHEAITLVGRDALQATLRRNEELEEAVEVMQILGDPEIREAVEAAEAQIDRGEGLSFEEAFGEKL